MAAILKCQGPAAGPAEREEQMTKPCPGPLPATRPKLKAPPGACDAHMHILGPYHRFPLSESRGYTAPESPLEDFLRLQDTLGLQRAVIVHPSAYGTDMRVTEDAVVRMNGRARGVAVVEPGISDAELNRLDRIGLRANGRGRARDRQDAGAVRHRRPGRTGAALRRPCRGTTAAAPCRRTATIASGHR